MISESQAGKKARVLVVYYSQTGNTHGVAKHIRDLTDGDLVELVPVDPYPDDYSATTQQAKRELQSGYKPPLQTKVENIAAYDIICVGSPNWWNTVAGPVKTFLSDYDLSGKRLAPFITHGGGGAGRSVADIGKWCPRASVANALVINGYNAASSRADVAAWLCALDVIREG
jgi:flavodoxin